MSPERKIATLERRLAHTREEVEALELVQRTALNWLKDIQRGLFTVDDALLDLES